MMFKRVVGVSSNCRICAPPSVGAVGSRRHVSERFQLEKKGITFVSQKTDADVLLALRDNPADFPQRLLLSGQEGRWSKKMRAWAHYIAAGRDVVKVSTLEEEDGDATCENAGVLVRIDSRERKLLEHIRDHEKDGFPFSVETLRVADVIIGSPPYEMFVERKSLNDLVSSIFDTRLHNQLGNKLHATDYERFRTLLIVEGHLSSLRMKCAKPAGIVEETSEQTYESKRRLVNSTLARITIRDQIPVLRSSDLAGTFEIIRTLVEEYPRITKYGPAQYSVRLDKPHRPRRGEDPREVLSDQLRCVRGLSRYGARCLAEGHPHMQSFLTSMLSAEDPVEWLM